MDELSLLTQALSAGGDTAMILVAVGLWRLEKRITVAEFRIESIIKTLK